MTTTHDGCLATRRLILKGAGAVTLTGAEGEALGSGHFSKSIVVVPANASWYVVCAYLDATPSAIQTSLNTAAT